VAIYLGAKLVEEVIKEMERIDQETKRKSRSKLLSVLPRALEVITGGRR
jgi:hypothetical protein